MATMHAPASLGYLGLGARDLESWSQFALNVLGAEAVDDDHGRVLLRTDAAHHRVSITHADSDRLDFVGWELIDDHHLDDVRAQLERGGVEVHDADAAECAARGVRSMVWCVDPAGIRQEFFWGRSTYVSAPFRSPAGVTAFVDGIGHYVLFSEYADDTRRFFVDLLGFRVSDFRDSAWFLRCNHRHHSIAVVASSSTRMHHFMLEVADLDDVGRALDRAIVAGCQSRSLGRHSNDRAVSFYLRTPSGGELEYGWGSVRIGDQPRPIHEIDSGDSWGHVVLDQEPM